MLASSDKETANLICYCKLILISADAILKQFQCFRRFWCSRSMVNRAAHHPRPNHVEQLLEHVLLVSHGNYMGPLSPPDWLHGQVCAWKMSVATRTSYATDWLDRHGVGLFDGPV